MSNAANIMQGPRRTRAAGADRPGIGLDEELITLTEAVKLLPRVDGKKPAVCTLWRWCRKGLRGVCIEYVRVGRRICTSRQALLRFFTPLADGQSVCAPGCPRFRRVVGGGRTGPWRPS